MSAGRAEGAVAWLLGAGLGRGFGAGFPARAGDPEGASGACVDAIGAAG
jgi:hypothetical protein